MTHASERAQHNNEQNNEGQTEVTQVPQTAKLSAAVHPLVLHRTMVIE